MPCWPFNFMWHQFSEIKWRRPRAHWSSSLHSLKEKRNRRRNLRDDWCYRRLSYWNWIPSRLQSISMASISSMSRRYAMRKDFYWRNYTTRIHTRFSDHFLSCTNDTPIFRITDFSVWAKGVLYVTPAVLNYGIGSLESSSVLIFLAQGESVGSLSRDSLLQALRDWYFIVRGKVPLFHSICRFFFVKSEMYYATARWSERVFIP